MATRCCHVYIICVSSYFQVTSLPEIQREERCILTGSDMLGEPAPKSVRRLVHAPILTMGAENPPASANQSDFIRKSPREYKDISDLETNCATVPLCHYHNIDEHERFIPRAPRAPPARGTRHGLQGPNSGLLCCATSSQSPLVTRSASRDCGPHDPHGVLSSRVRSLLHTSYEGQHTEVE